MDVCAVPLPRETSLTGKRRKKRERKRKKEKRLERRHLLKKIENYIFIFFVKDEVGGEEKPVYKKVAVVEEFFDIIYREHVEFMNHGGRPTANGKHAGQKRTYRAVSFIYF